MLEASFRASIWPWRCLTLGLWQRPMTDTSLCFLPQAFVARETLHILMFMLLLHMSYLLYPHSISYLSCHMPNDHGHYRNQQSLKRQVAFIGASVRTITSAIACTRQLVRPERNHGQALIRCLMWLCFGKLVPGCNSEHWCFWRLHGRSLASGQSSAWACSGYMG
jgi:hypothetical protein